MTKVLNNTILFLVIGISLLFGGFAAVAEAPPLSVGKHLAAQGNYDAAITEYKRFLFFHPEDARVGEVYYNIGLAYRAHGLWTEAITGLQTAMHLAVDSEAKSEYQLELAVTLIAAQDYDLARLESIKVMMRSPSTRLYRRALFFQGVACIYQFRWEEAREALQAYTTDEGLNVRFLTRLINMPREVCQSRQSIVGDPSWDGADLRR